MKWQFEISDVPDNPDYPITAYQYTDSGVKRGPFYMSTESFIEALQKEPNNLLDADGIRGDEKSSPSLPFGTIRYSTNDTGTRERITMEIPKKQWDIRYQNDDNFFTIGFPRMVVQYLIVSNLQGNKVIKEMRIYAVEDNRKPVSDDTPLFTFPYPNVGKENGIVCWGQNERLEIKELVELERSFFWFISAPFNEDHGVRTTLGFPSFKKLIEEIKDQPFNDEWLVPNNKDFGALFTTTKLGRDL